MPETAPGNTAIGVVLTARTDDYRVGREILQEMSEVEARLMTLPLKHSAGAKLQIKGSLPSAARTKHAMPYRALAATGCQTVPAALIELDFRTG